MVYATEVNLLPYYKHELSDMEKEVEYLMNLPKQELAIRYAALEQAVNHVAMRNFVWDDWRLNIKLWESKYGFIFERSKSNYEIQKGEMVKHLNELLDMDLAIEQLEKIGVYELEELIDKIHRMKVQKKKPVTRQAKYKPSPKQLEIEF